MQKFYVSSIMKKLIMSLSGLFLIVFLFVHLGCNLASLASQEAYNAVCEFMDQNPLIRIMVPVLALGFIIHIVLAFILTLQNRNARGNDRYAVKGKSEVHWAGINMFVLGLIVFLGLGLHLTHFWAKMQLQSFLGNGSSPDPFGIVVELFSNPLYVVIYLVWIWALWFHLTHGFWSALQSIGWNNNKWLCRLQCIGNVIAWVIALGFTIIPVYFLFIF